MNTMYKQKQDMKTPMQKLEEIILERRDLAIRNLQNYPIRSDIYETAIFLCEDILETIDYLIQEEKDLIVASYYYGWHDGHNYIDTMPKTGFEPEPLYKDGEDFYNKKFNTKEK